MSFNCFSSIQKQPALLDSRVCCSVGCYGCSVAVKIPKLYFCHTSCIIVGLVEQVFDKCEYVVL